MDPQSCHVGGGAGAGGRTGERTGERTGGRAGWVARRAGGAPGPCRPPKGGWACRRRRARDVRVRWLGGRGRRRRDGVEEARSARTPLVGLSRRPLVGVPLAGRVDDAIGFPVEHDMAEGREMARAPGPVLALVVVLLEVRVRPGQARGSRRDCGPSQPCPRWTVNHLLGPAPRFGPAL